MLLERRMTPIEKKWKKFVTILICQMYLSALTKYEKIQKFNKIKEIKQKL